ATCVRKTRECAVAVVFAGERCQRVAGQQDGVEFHCRHAREQGPPVVRANDVFGGDAMESRRAQARNGLTVHDQRSAVGEACESKTRESQTFESQTLDSKACELKACDSKVFDWKACELKTGDAKTGDAKTGDAVSSGLHPARS